MTQKYLQISTTKETRRIFNEYFEKNKEYFGTKASMFRFMVYNLDILAKFNSKIVNPEKKKLEKERAMYNLENNGETNDNFYLYKIICIMGIFQINILMVNSIKLLSFPLLMQVFVFVLMLHLLDLINNLVQYLT